MLLWSVIAVGFVVCLAAGHLWRGITWGEAGILFIASSIIFAVHLGFIYNKTTTDHYLISGYVTSLVHQPAYSYQSGTKIISKPEKYIIEQQPRPAIQDRTITRRFNDDKGTEICRGECLIFYRNFSNINYTPPGKDNVRIDWFPVSREKFNRTKIGDTSAVFRPYFNPVQVSDDVVYNGGDHIPYFKVNDYNRAWRIVAPTATPANQENLERLNTELSSLRISVGLIVTPDNLYFEKLKRAWHQGKPNDFVVVVTSPDNKTIQNVNILGWDNYTLKEAVAKAVMAAQSADIDKIIPVIGNTIQQNNNFTPTNFSRYNFLNIKIPDDYYWKVLIYQVFFFAYMLVLLNFNPITKDKDDKRRIYHLLTDPSDRTGIFFHIGIPFIVAMMMWGML